EVLPASLYFVCPVYNKPYYIEVDDNIPEGADSGSKVVKKNYEQKVYENDRNRLLPNIELSLPGYKFEGFSREANGVVEYNKGDIVRKYGDLDKRAEEKVKELFVSEFPTIRLYAKWKPINYYVVFDKGNEYVSVSRLKIVENPKAFGVEYNDLMLNTSEYTYRGHNFLYWEVDRVISGGEVVNGVARGGVDEHGYRYERATLSDTASYKNLTTIDGAIVVLKAIWNSVSYRVRFDVATPSGIAVKRYGKVVDSEGKEVSSVQLLNDESYLAPRTTTVLDGYEFKGWDKEAIVATPTYIPGRDYIHGLGRNLNSEVVLYGIWGKETTKVVEPEEEDEPKKPDDEAEKPHEPLDKDEDGNDFVYYILGTISDTTGDRIEKDFTDKELMAHIKEGETLRDALDGDIISGATYYEYPIYNNVYTIKLEDNIPAGAEASDKVVKNKSEMNIYLDDRQRLFNDLDISLPGYKFEGFSRTSSGDVEYRKGDIVRKYKYEEDRLKNTNNNVKALYEEEGTKTITLYCVWTPINYFVVFEKGSSYVVENSVKTVTNPKSYGVEYRDLTYFNNYRYAEHTFMYWEVDKVSINGEINGGVLVGGEEVPGYLYERKILNQADTYKNLTNIDGAIVTLKAIWTENDYTINFDENLSSLPSDAVIESVGSVDSVTLLNSESVLAPTQKSVVKGYVLKGWDRMAHIATPTFVAGVDYIHGIGREKGGTVTLYGIWGKPTSEVEIPEENGGDGETHKVDEEISSPSEPHDKDEFGNKFLYYNIEKVEHTDRVREEDELTNKELLTHFGGETTLQDALGSELLDNVKYIGYPVYANEYTVKIDTNKPYGAESGDEVEYNVLEQKIYKDDRQELFKDLEMTLNGYEFIGLSETKDGDAYIRPGDITRLYYAGLDTNDTDNVKSLREVSGSKEITLYAKWRPIHYFVVFDKGNDTVVVNAQKIASPIEKEYGVTYNDLRLNDSYRYNGHNFLYWEIDRVVEGGSVDSSGNIVGGVDVDGYLYKRATLSETEIYKNLTNINNGIVVLKAIWSDLR
ncbi:MAG: hypothetical protein IKP66_00090, partial [Lachnospiraceae bacterium]|nr:hypothetical protein [Lachnospiraceae bacterium]